MRNERKKEFIFEILYRLEQLWNFFVVFGRGICANGKKGVRRLANWFGRYAFPATQTLRCFAARCGGFIKRHFSGIGGFACAVWHSFGILREDIGTIWSAAGDLSIGKRLRKVLQYLAGPAKQRKRMAISAFNYAMPVLALVVAVNMISALIHTDYAFAVTYNGVELGLVEDETVYSDAAKDMQSRIIIPDDGEAVPVAAELSLRAVGNKDEVVSSAELTNRMMQNAGQDIVEAEGVYVDGSFIGAVEEVGRVQNYLNDTLNKYLMETGYNSASFTKDITVEKGFYVADNLISYEQVQELLESETASAQYYHVQPGDTPIGIAAELGVNYQDLIAWNPGIDTFLIADSEILVGVSEPYLSIEAKTVDTYTRKLNYKSVEEKTDRMYVGEKKVKREGKKGEQIVTAEVTLLNGIETDRKVLSKETVEEAVDEIVLVGTKKPDPVTVPSGVHTGGSNNTGITLSWPTSGGYISSAYGSRWGSFHRAIDIAKRGGCYGDRIFAAADGKVTYVGYSGTYGKLIKISHGNGLETWYAHCSGYNVSTGDRVSRGDTIGYIGNTGRSTGPHLHFQVMLHGRYVNPVNYLR